MITNPFLQIKGIDSETLKELKEIERLLEFLNNIKITHNEKVI